MVTGRVPTWVEHVMWQEVEPVVLLSNMLIQHITRITGVTRPYPYLEKRHLGTRLNRRDKDMNQDRKMGI